MGNGDIRGVRIAPTAPPVTHLLFADDIFIFGKATAGEFSSIKDALELYEGDIPTTVADIRTGQQGWNVELIQQTFSPHETSMILSLPLSDISTSDELYWHPTTSGLFTVKSAYQLSSQSQTNANNSCFDSTFWKIIWKLEVASKMKIVDSNRLSGVPKGWNTYERLLHSDLLGRPPEYDSR
ncbi:hypothetical protein M569_09402 [Genlisea aurea]|uniref:Reverse transcriptase domain-containing protein n=1 Tax=Genlisea aurea TaxID=192259 RepID=S8CL04_9LAMI|nr:hypothetical protein M569_09402 [Genlisea aurea]